MQESPVACPGSFSPLLPLWCSCCLLLKDTLQLFCPCMQVSVIMFYILTPPVIRLSCWVHQSCFLGLNDGSGSFNSILLMNQCSAPCFFHCSDFYFQAKVPQVPLSCGTNNAWVIPYNCREINYYQTFCAQPSWPLFAMLSATLEQEPLFPRADALHAAGLSDATA